MSDPFWRRFSASKDRPSAHPPHSRERTLSTEYTSLNTRTSSSALAPPTTTTAPRRSRNDLFETDWGWKGDTEERNTSTGSAQHALRGLGIVVPASTAHQDQLPEYERSALCSKTDTPAEQSPTQHSPARSAVPVLEPVLGAPIQLKSTSPIPAHQPFSHHTDQQSPLRSRNDTIYNVNHSTITPPRSNTPVPSTAGGTRSPFNPVSVSARQTMHSPLSDTRDNSPANRSIASFPRDGQNQQETTDDRATQPRRSISASSSSSGSSTSDFSGITSFVDRRPSSRSEGRARPVDVSTGRRSARGNTTEQSRYGTTTTSPAVSPITPVTPDTHFPLTFTSSFSSFPHITDGKKAPPEQQVQVPSSPFATTIKTPTTMAVGTTTGRRSMVAGNSSGYNPSSAVSRSRASSITIVRSPSTALANITRNAGRLLVPDSDADNMGVDDAAAGGSDAEVTRVRVDIESRQWLVGYGRYAKVYLGSYKPELPPLPATSPISTAPRIAETDVPPVQTSTGWNLCAAKVCDSDMESMNMANRESAMLGYLQEDLPSTQLRLQNSVRQRVEESGNGDTDGRRYLLSRIGLVDETIIEPPPSSFTARTPGDLSRSGSQRTSRATTDMDALCRSSTDRLPGTMSEVSLERANDALSLRQYPQTVYTAQRGPRGRQHGHSRAASETTAILQQLGRNTISAKSSTNVFLFDGGGRERASSLRPILLLPFYANGSMATFLKTGDEAVGEELWIKWFEQGLRALNWCKMKGVLHNDIKPANFLLDDDMNLRLGDFGSAMRINPDNPPHDGIGLGTVSYSSPEIVDPSTERTFSFPSDVFSFGVTMRQCMTGREPYEGLRTVELMYHVRKGNYWEWHARREIDLPSSPTSATSSRFPTYPTAAVAHHLARVRATTTTATSPTDRNHPAAHLNDGVRRAESLREPSRNRVAVRRPALARTPSSDIVVRQANAVSMSTCVAANVMEVNAGEITVQDQRERWLRRMVDPDPANRPEVEDLLDLSAGYRAVQEVGADCDK
ncbi:hypothetical protein QFC21_004632 [Naganishia friedmannii]|uniref:Uncharacterized protein n=1 Tax=Naganishia friedmannii TaxID=89922 RepID=A0ACC2VE74_9TREE|nr:hypothetical protein QFC21_004632 [Naganishia friedmannii]